MIAGLLKEIRFRAGYFDTDEHAYPEGALAPGSSNYFVTAQDALRPFKGIARVEFEVGGTQMFQVAGGYAALNPSTPAVGSVTLTGGGAGSVNGITIAGTQIMSGVENFDTSLAQTAANVAANISAYSINPNYVAIAVGAIIYIVAAASGTGENGKAVVPSTTTITTTVANMAGGVNGTTGNGSIFNFINESLFWIGAGSIYYNGAPLLASTGTPFTATSSLQLSLKNGTTYAEAYTAGLAQPSAPTVVAREPGIGFTGQLTGVYSFKIARVRSVTGGRSIASPTSATITTEEQTALLTFPALDSNGQDRWAIFATRAGFGGVGVHWLVEEIDDTELSTIDSIPRSYEMEFKDSDLLGVVAWIDDYPPPAGSFAGALENYILVVGCYDNAIAASIRNFPESYNPEHLAYLPQTPTAILPDQMGSYMYVATERSVHALSITFADNPMAIQTLWSDIGIKNPHNWTAVQGRIFAFVSQQGAVTMDNMGNPSNEFSIPVSNAMETWDIDNVGVYHAPQINSVLYVYAGKAYAFNYQNGKWSPPAGIDDYISTAVVTSGVVVNRELYLSVKEVGAPHNVYKFDADPTPTESVVCIAVSPYYSLGDGRMDIDGIKVKCENSTSNNIVAGLEFDYDVTDTKTLTYAGVAGTNTTQRTRWFLPRKESIRVKVTQIYTQVNDTHPIYVLIFGEPEPSEKL